MLLSIDAVKVTEQLERKPFYTVTWTSNLETQIAKTDEPVSAHIYSTVTEMPVDMERARARLLSLRRSLIAKGVQPLSREEFERSISDTRA